MAQRGRGIGILSSNGCFDLFEERVPPSPSRRGLHRSLTGVIENSETTDRFRPKRLIGFVRNPHADVLVVSIHARSFAPDLTRFMIWRMLTSAHCFEGHGPAAEARQAQPIGGHRTLSRRPQRSALWMQG